MSDDAELIKHIRETNDHEKLYELVPYTKFIGMEIMKLGNEFIYKLPAKESNIGNPTLPALHGGVIGGFLENSAIFHTIATLPVQTIPKVVDFSLDYLRAGRFEDTYCNCTIVRQGRRVANVSAAAWQSTQDEPIAVARCHLLLNVD